MTSSIDLEARAKWPASWASLDRGGREAFLKARELTLNLIQWPARIANSYVADSSAEGRLTLDFHRDGSIVTRTFDHGIALELRLPALEMQFQENGKRVPHILDTEEHSPAEVEAWILVELLHRGVDRDKFSKSLPYTIPNLLSGDAEDYSPASCADGLAQLTAWFGAASSILSGHGRVVCLPQTLTLMAVPERGKPAAGFSPGDAERDEPYFFAAGGSEKKRILAASELSNEKHPADVAAQFIAAAAGATRA
jgi:hypothetical protein